MINFSIHLRSPQYRSLMNTALKAASMADYCDVRIVRLGSQFLSFENGQKEQDEWNETLGMAIRVMVNGGWGFASTPFLNEQNIKEQTQWAVMMAKESARVQTERHRLAPKNNHEDLWSYPELRPYQALEKPEVESWCEHFSSKMHEHHSSIKKAKAYFRYKKTHWLYQDSEGSDLEQVWMRTGLGLAATSVAFNDVQTRTFRSRQAYAGGLETISLPLYEKTWSQVAEEAYLLTQAPELPAQKATVIIGTNQLALQIHESVGHPNELDRVLGWEANFAGTSFNQLSHRGHLQYGSSLVNLVADQTLPGGTGTRAYDDEGVKAQRWYIVKEGIFKNYYTSRDTALTLGEKEQSMGCCRADSWSTFPIIRIPNVSLLPHRGSFQELVKNTEHGFYFDTNRSWSIDQRRDQFQFGVELVREIKEGSFTKVYKNGVYRGRTLPFWNSCDAICGPEEYDVFGEIFCGKGQPMQSMEMSHGCSPARFTGIEIKAG